ncbi:MAG: hypothetical protein Q4D76_02060 [Oscillospiraceae bacterium]|nr:hypothetical protein [Oscillospiraceae bacterium]
MGRFIYQHFGDDVPRHIEVEYNRMLRREQYLEEREMGFRAMSADFNAVQEVMPDPATLPTNEIADERQRQRNARLNFLPVALEMLRCDFPEGYELIKDYYFNKEKVTLLYLVEKYGLTKPVVKYRLKIAREKLKSFIIAHENGE